MSSPILTFSFPISYCPSFFSPQLPETSAADREAIVQRLQSGLAKTGAQFPIQTGCVHKDVETGRPYVKCTIEHTGILLYVKGASQVSSEIPSYGKFMAANFRPDLIQAQKLLPLSALYDPSLKPSENNLPACACQVTFIDGGLVLGYAINHLVADMPATELFLRTWAANSRDGSGINQTVHPNRAILQAKDLDISKQHLDEIEHRLATVGHLSMSQFWPDKNDTAPRPKAISSIIAFSAQAGRALKAEVIRSLRQDIHISTWDCLTALTWRAVIRARLQAYPEHAAIDSALFHSSGLRGNRIAAFPADYFGNAVVQSTSGPTSAATLLKPDALPALAKNDRDRIFAVDRSIVDDLVQWTGARAIPTGCLWTSRKQGLMDVAFTSWANVSCYQTYDFGFGLPGALRVPDLSGRHTIILPNRMYEDGVERFEMYLGAEPVIHELLMKDGEFRKYADRYDVDLGR